MDIVGSRTAPAELQPWNLIGGDLHALSRPDAVAVDQSYFGRLQTAGLGDHAEINDQSVRITAVTRGIRALFQRCEDIGRRRGVSLGLQGGQLALLMGPSGSGKTTLLTVLGCMLSPTRGIVKVHGRATQGLSAEELAKIRREHIGFIFQSYHLFPTLTACENVRMALDLRGQRGAASSAKAKDALASVGLAHKLSAFPRELSGGEQQRVAIARAIAGSPSLILADEPTGALDSENGEAIMGVLAQIADDPSRAVFVVTHDPRIVPFADRIVHIEDGRIVRDEPKRGEGENASRDESRVEDKFRAAPNPPDHRQLSTEALLALEFGQTRGSFYYTRKQQAL